MENTAITINIIIKTSHAELDRLIVFVNSNYCSANVSNLTL